MSRSTVVLVPAIAVAAIITAVSVALALQDADRQQPPKAAGLHGSQLPQALRGRAAPTFRLPDARGGVIDTGKLRGRPYAVTFLYTRCPDVCPVIGQDLKQALARLGDRARRFSVIVVSVDPRGDTAEAVRAWLRRQRLPVQVRYGIGSQAELQPVWKAFYSEPQIPGRPESSVHTAAVWLIDARGRLRARYPGGAPIEPAELASDFDRLLREATPSAQG